MSDVSDIATRVQEHLTTAIGGQLQTVTSTLQQALSAVRHAVDRQAQAPVEQILERLQSVVSGGFDRESRNMAAALDSFAQVVPSLEVQLRSLTDTVATQSKQHAEDTARVTTAVLERVAGLVDALGQQQYASEQAMQRVLAASEQGAATMTARLAASSEGVVSSVLAATRAELDAVTAGMRQASEMTVARYSAFDQHAAEASAAIRDASAELQKGAEGLRAERAYVQAALAQVKAGGDALQAASGQFMKVSDNLGKALGETQKLLQQMQAQARELLSAQAQQQATNKEMERVWPTLFGTYLTQFKASSDELANAWQQTYRHVQSMTNSVGADFVAAAEELSQTMGDLLAHLKQQPAQPVTSPARAGATTGPDRR